MKIKKEKTSFHVRKLPLAGRLKNAFFHCNLNGRFLQAKTARSLIQKFPVKLVHLAVSEGFPPAAGTGAR